MISAKDLRSQADKKMGRLPGFLKCYLGFADKEGSLEKVAELYQSAGNKYHLDGESLEAIECYKSAVNLYSKIPFRSYDCVQIYETMGQISRRIDINESILYYKLAIANCEREKTPNYSKLERLATKLVEIYEEMKDYSNAIDACEFSLRMMESSSQNKVGLVNKYLKMGKFELYQNDFTNSIRHFELAHEYETTNPVYSGENLYCAILVCYFELVRSGFSFDLAENMRDELRKWDDTNFVKCTYYSTLELIIDCIEHEDNERLLDQILSDHSVTYCRNKFEIAEISRYIINNMVNILKDQVIDLT